ncbi:hypothetical protein ACFY2M_41770 [Streptomyces sp. NPDC001276]|uniref:hypothetical protein n=1 Tax=Streptomyces sp. NPDC001276 TaxID=3364555 RepID=UPI0036C43E4B
MSTADIGELLRTIDRLACCVESLRSRSGERTAVLRLAKNIERLRNNAAALTSAAGPALSTAADAHTTMIPDAPYDPKLWQGADDEGIGGHRPQICPTG